MVICIENLPAALQVVVSVIIHGLAASRVVGTQKWSCQSVLDRGDSVSLSAAEIRCSRGEVSAIGSKRSRPSSVRDRLKCSSRLRRKQQALRGRSKDEGLCLFEFLTSHSFGGASSVPDTSCIVPSLRFSFPFAHPPAPGLCRMQTERNISGAEVLLVF